MSVKNLKNLKKKVSELLAERMGEKIMKRRQALRINQREVAQRLGCCIQRVCRIEKGKVDINFPVEIPLLMGILKIGDLDWFLEDLY